MTPDKFGDLFYEIPEPEIFLLPCGGSISSECTINSLGLTYTVEVIPRQEMIDRCTGMTPHNDVALGFQIREVAGTGEALISLEETDVHLATIDAETLPAIRHS